MLKRLMLIAVCACVGLVFADEAGVEASPLVARRAKTRDAAGQDSTWTSEKIAANPVQFLQSQIVVCDQLRAKMDAQNITLVRVEKRASRAVEEAMHMKGRYEAFLKDAKAAYKAANGSWPVKVDGDDFDEEELVDRIADAMARVEMAKKDYEDNTVIAKNASIRRGVLKSKRRELVRLRMRLVQQAEQVKMEAALVETDTLKASLGAIQDLMTEVERDSALLSLGEKMADEASAERNQKVRAFLND